MARIIRFVPRPRKTAKDGKGDCLRGQDEELETTLISLSRDLKELAEHSLGTSLMPEKDTSKLKSFFFNLFVARLRRIREHFRAYSYLSELLSDPSRVDFTYAVDMISASLEGKPISHSSIGDNCFVIASLWPEWLNRKGNSMKRSDYLSLGASFYYSEALSRLDGSRPLYEDLARNISKYSDVVLEARGVLGLGGA